MLNIWLRERSAWQGSRCIGCGQEFKGGEDVQELRRGSANSDFLLLGHKTCLIEVGYCLTRLVRA